MKPSDTSTFLRWALLADAATSGAIGLLMMLGSGLLDQYLGLPAALARYAGMSLLPFASNSRFRKSAELNVVKFSHLPIESFHGAEKLHLKERAQALPELGFGTQARADLAEGFPTTLDHLVYGEGQEHQQRHDRC